MTATSLTTALNTAYLAEQVALFSVAMGVALLLTGIGFLVLTIGVLRSRSEPTTAKPSPRRPDGAARKARPEGTFGR